MHPYSEFYLFLHYEGSGVYSFTLIHVYMCLCFSVSMFLYLFFCKLKYLSHFSHQSLIKIHIFPEGMPYGGIHFLEKFDSHLLFSEDFVYFLTLYFCKLKFLYTFLGNYSSSVFVYIPDIVIGKVGVTCELSLRYFLFHLHCRGFWTVNLYTLFYPILNVWSGVYYIEKSVSHAVLPLQCVIL